MNDDPTAPADRPPTGAGAAKVAGFADRVRFGTEVQKAKRLRGELALHHQAVLNLAGELEGQMADMDALIEGLERLMNPSAAKA